MAINQAILLGVNEIDTVVASSELGGDFVAENLINQQPSELWKAAAIPSPAQVQFTGDLGRNKVISGFALGNHNLTAETIRLELATDSGYTDVVYDNSWTVEQAYYAWGTGTWGDMESTWGGYSLDSTGLESQFIKTFAETYCRYYRVTLSGLTVVPQAGVLFLGEALQSGVARNPRIPVVDPSTQVMTRGQAIRSDNQPTYREIEVFYVKLNPDQAHVFRRICRFSGRKKIAVFVLQPGAEGVEYIETSMVCRLVDWDGPERIGQSKQTYYTARAVFREAL